METTLTPAQRQIRQNVRNFLFVATPAELEKELAVSLELHGEGFHAECIRELMKESGKPLPMPNGWNVID